MSPLYKKIQNLSLFLLLSGATLAVGNLAHAQETWKPAPGPLSTRWAKEVDPAKVWPEYPRPQLVRAAWQNLNGLWDFALAPRDAARPASFADRILVPFPVESSLSGIARKVTAKDAMWYRTSVKIRYRQPGKRVLLNFEAVDFAATVWVNDREVGYEPFSLDITEALAGSDTAELAGALTMSTLLIFQTD